MNKYGVLNKREKIAWLKRVRVEIETKGWYQGLVGSKYHDRDPDVSYAGGAENTCLGLALMDKWDRNVRSKWHNIDLKDRYSTPPDEQVAMEVAITLNKVKQWTSHPYDDYGDTVEPGTRISYSHIYQWNDTKSRKKQQVFDVIDKTIARLEAQ